MLESHENFHSFWLNWARTPVPSMVGKAVIPCVWPLVGRLSTGKYGFIYKARIVKENGRSFNSTIFVWALIFITHTRFCSEAGITFKNVMINLGKPICQKLDIKNHSTVPVKTSFFAIHKSKQGQFKVRYVSYKYCHGSQLLPPKRYN